MHGFEVIKYGYFASISPGNRYFSALVSLDVQSSGFQNVGRSWRAKGQIDCS